jgi:hypothetical protein
MAKLKGEAEEFLGRAFQVYEGEARPESASHISVAANALAHDVKEQYT